MPRPRTEFHLTRAARGAHSQAARQHGTVYGEAWAGSGLCDAGLSAATAIPACSRCWRCPKPSRDPCHAASAISEFGFRVHREPSSDIMKIEPKEKARARGIASPDRAEALMLALGKRIESVPLWIREDMAGHSYIEKGPP